MENVDFSSPHFDDSCVYVASDGNHSRPTVYTATMPGNWPYEAEDLDHEQSMTHNMMLQHHQYHHHHQHHHQHQQAQILDDYSLQHQEMQHQEAHPTTQNLLNQDWHFPSPSANQPFTHENPLDTSFQGSYRPRTQSNQTDYLPASEYVNHEMPPNSYMAISGPMGSMNALAYPLNPYQNDMMFHMSMQNLHRHSADFSQSSAPGSSPTGSYLEVRSLTSSDNGWNAVDFPVSTNSLEYPATANAVFNPGQTLHIRSTSDSSIDDSTSAQLSGSYEEISVPLYSPASDAYHPCDYVKQEMPQSYNCSEYDHGSNSDHSHDHTPGSSSPDGIPNTRVSKASVARTARITTLSSASSSPTSPPTRRRKSPTNASTKNTKATIKKTTSSAGRKDSNGEKRVGRRSGPLRPDQRQQAHEIRKLRACIRCKFLKKTCDTGDPCSGCRPSHARQWQTPCTRLDIKDINFFMKDWKADYVRHDSKGFSVGNIRGFSQTERLIYVTHGYGHYLPINAREVYVCDTSCFQTDWTEKTIDPQSFEVTTAKLSAGMEGVSASELSEYLDRHLEKGFEFFVDHHFNGTPFLTEMLKTAHRYWSNSKSPVIRKALKLVVAYNLTTHVTLVEGLPTDEYFHGMVENDESKYVGKTMAPVMISHQVKEALADMWRELQKDILEELSGLYSSLYGGDREVNWPKNWPTIFMLAAILLAIWEEMQFDAHYRTPDEAAVDKFCTDMENTPVGVVVGLFQTISQKVPAFMEWDTTKHQQLFNGSNPAICDALTEVKNHVTKHGKSMSFQSCLKRET